MAFQKYKDKTPMQKAIVNVRTAYILAFITAGITLIAALLSLAGEEIVEGINIFALIDVALVLALAILLVTIKSRVAAIIMFVYFLLSKVIIFIDNPDTIASSIFMAILFVVGYFYGILGTFSYHKLKKEDQDPVIQTKED